MADENNDALLKLLVDVPSAQVAGERDLATVMQYGTNAQKEAALLVLRLLAQISPGAHAAPGVEFAAITLKRAMRVQG